MSLFSSLFGSRKKKEQSAVPDQTFRPSAGWIRVQHGNSDSIILAIKNHSGISKKESPQTIRIRVVESPDGFYAISFPDGIPIYDFINLVGWLNQPPDIDTVSSATGWVTPPFSKTRYYLIPETENDWGDTLIGTSSDGKNVQVYLPEATMCEISRKIRTSPEPDLSALPAESGEITTIEVDVNSSFGNPEFEITHPEDTDWNK